MLGHCTGKYTYAILNCESFCFCSTALSRGSRVGLKPNGWLRVVVQTPLTGTLKHVSSRISAFTARWTRRVMWGHTGRTSLPGIKWLQSNTEWASCMPTGLLWQSKVSGSQKTNLVKQKKKKKKTLFYWDKIYSKGSGAEPRPDQLNQPQVVTLHPQACTVGTWHDGCITSSASRLTLTLCQWHIQIWNAETLTANILSWRLGWNKLECCPVLMLVANLGIAHLSLQ